MPWTAARNSSQDNQRFPPGKVRKTGEIWIVSSTCLYTHEPISVSDCHSRMIFWVKSICSHHQIKEMWEVPYADWPVSICDGLIMRMITMTTFLRPISVFLGENAFFFFVVVPCVLRLRRSLRGTTTKTKKKQLHYVNLNEPRLTDQRASGVLVQTMFIKDIWDNLWHRSLEGTRFTQSEYWRALEDKTEELRCLGEQLTHTLFYCAHHHTHFYGD